MKQATLAQTALSPAKQFWCKIPQARSVHISGKKTSQSTFSSKLVAIIDEDVQVFNVQLQASSFKHFKKHMKVTTK